MKIPWRGVCQLKAQLRKNAEYPFALQLSGHTHGGQIALPFARSLRTRDGTEIYEAGFYRRNDTTMYVSRGIGTSIVRMRLFEPPEIVVLTLRRSD
jgi:predicted MPP superfamily phosphohydrolase